MRTLSRIDYAVIAAYFLCVAGIGYWAAMRKKKTTDDYFLASRRIPGWIVGLLCVITALLLISARAKALVELIVTLGMIFSGGMLGLFALGFLSRRATRQGAYVGMAVCIIFILWAALTGPLNVDLGFNFRMHPIMIGVFSHFILFASGYLASLVFGGYRPDLSGLTIWKNPVAPGEAHAQPAPEIAANTFHR